MKLRRTPATSRRPVGHVVLLAAGMGLAAGVPASLAFASGANVAGASTFRAAAGYPSAQTVTIAPGTGGNLQYAFVDRQGTVYWRAETSTGWSAWAPLSASQKNGKTLTPSSMITWAPGSAGSTMELFGEDGGSVYVTWLTGTTWSTWTVLSATSSTPDAFGGEITYAPGAGSAVQEVFAIDADSLGASTGYLYEKTEVGGGWGKWTKVGTRIFHYDFTGITYAPGSNGSTQELFVSTFGAKPAPTTQTATPHAYVTWSTGGTWHTWVTFAPGDAVVPWGPITYAPGSNGSLQEVFSVGFDTASTAYGAIVDWENPNGTWSGWVTMTKPATAAEGFYTSRVTYAPGSNGSLQELFAITKTQCGVWVDWENPGGTWAGWHSMGAVPPNLQYTYQGYFNWFSMSDATGSNGSLQEIAATSTTATHPVYVQWENPGGTWSGWTVWSATTS